MDIYGTIGPACLDVSILADMFRKGMTGIRLNLSHITLENASHMIEIYHRAAKEAGVYPAKLLIDMQGPEIRIGELTEAMVLKEKSIIRFGQDGIPVPDYVLAYLTEGKTILLDDGKILLRMLPNSWEAEVIRGGILQGRKSLAIEDTEIPSPSLTPQDLENLKVAKEYGVTGVMQPFVRDRQDLMNLRSAMRDAGCEDLTLYAKIENLNGIEHLDDFLDLSDEIVIARGDLGNAMPLWELPKAQKHIAMKCKKAKKPFMVVTQMLASMEHSMVPTRAEVSDIYNAVLDGASSVMVTGETAVGDYPAEVIKYLANTAYTAWKERI